VINGSPVYELGSGRYEFRLTWPVIKAK